MELFAIRVEPEGDGRANWEVARVPCPAPVFGFCDPTRGKGSFPRAAPLRQLDGTGSETDFTFYADLRYAWISCPVLPEPGSRHVAQSVRRYCQSAHVSNQSDRAL